MANADSRSIAPVEDWQAKSLKRQTKSRRLIGFISLRPSGAEEIRTPDLCIANAASTRRNRRFYGRSDGLPFHGFRAISLNRALYRAWFAVGGHMQNRDDDEMGKRETAERQLIAESPRKRPYGARMSFEVTEGRTFHFPVPCSIIADDTHIVSLDRQTSDQDDWTTIDASIVGCTSAAAAEDLEFRLSGGIMWAAVSHRVPVRLQYHTPFPSIVFDRTQPDGATLKSMASAGVTSRFAQFVACVREVFERTEKIDGNVLTSMELFTSARLEATARTRFLRLVSSLEPIAEQHTYRGPIDDLVEDCIASLGKAKDAFDDDVYNSLRGRISDLKRESVNFAIKRLVKECLPEDGAAMTVIRRSYDVRSQMLHERTTDDNIDTLASEIENLIRRLIAAKLELELGRP